MADMRRNDVGGEIHQQFAGFGGFGFGREATASSVISGISCPQS
jgi:hypothetical protein